MPQAFDRIPSRYKSWFFGAVDFKVREQLVLQQLAALRRRSEETDLSRLYSKVFPPGGVWPDWKSKFEELKKSLKTCLDEKNASINPSRTVYPFLRPLWGAMPVEDMTRVEGGDSGKAAVAADWLVSWPLAARDVAPTATENPAEDVGNKLTLFELRLIRDWARTAEDLIALQLVRWFGPPLSQLLPIMTFLVVGSLSLLIAAVSYPFDQQGWVMTIMVCLILFVAAVIGNVLIGVNRDELISRVSDTTPGQLTFDSGFISSLLTTIVPLFAALLVVSFDLSDILHTLLGPVLQAF
jgi:hypothetical protein